MVSLIDKPFVEEVDGFLREALPLGTSGVLPRHLACNALNLPV
jgi:hypothetical protein